MYIGVCWNRNMRVAARCQDKMSSKSERYSRPTLWEGEGKENCSMLSVHRSSKTVCKNVNEGFLENVGDL